MTCFLPSDSRTLHALSLELGENISSGQIFCQYDTHTGLHGSGVSLVAVQFKDASLAQSLAEEEGWQALPASETVQLLAYGGEVDGAARESYFVDKISGRALLPEITNGYAKLIDRQSDGEGELLQRDSLAITLAIYDADRNVMYICKLDT